MSFSTGGAMKMYGLNTSISDPAWTPGMRRSGASCNVNLPGGSAAATGGATVAGGNLGNMEENGIYTILETRFYPFRGSMQLQFLENIGVNPKQIPQRNLHLWSSCWWWFFGPVLGKYAAGARLANALWPFVSESDLCPCLFWQSQVEKNVSCIKNMDDPTRNSTNMDDPLCGWIHFCGLYMDDPL